MYGYEMVNAVKECLAIAEEAQKLINNKKDADDVIHEIIEVACGNRYTSNYETIFCVRATIAKLEEMGGYDFVIEGIYDEMERLVEGSQNWIDTDPYDNWESNGECMDFIRQWYGSHRHYDHEERVRNVAEMEELAGGLAEPNEGLKKGDVVEVVKGRKYPKGTQLVCLGFSTSMYDGKEQAYVGKDANGKSQYVTLANCKVVSLNDKFQTEVKAGDVVKVKKDVINPQTNVVVVRAGEYVVEGFYTQYNWYEMTSKKYYLVDGGKRLNVKCAEPVGYTLL